MLLNWIYFNFNININIPEKVLINVLVNNESKLAKNIEETKTLPEIRKLFGEKLPNDSIFTLPEGSEMNLITHYQKF